jgi:hypothetical protein
VVLSFLLLILFSIRSYAIDSTGVKPSTVNAATQVTASVLHIGNYNSTATATYCSTTGHFGPGKASNPRLYTIGNNTASSVPSFPGFYAFVYSCQETFWTNDPDYIALTNSSSPWFTADGSNKYCKGNPSVTTEFCSILNAKAPIITFNITPPGIFSSVNAQWLVFPLPNNPTAQFRLFASGTWNTLWAADTPVRSNPPANISAWVDRWPPSQQIYTPTFVGGFNNGWGSTSSAVNFFYFLPSQDNSGHQRNFSLTSNDLQVSANLFEKTCSIIYNVQATYTTGDAYTGGATLSCY